MEDIPWPSKTQPFLQAVLLPLPSSRELLQRSSIAAMLAKMTGDFLRVLPAGHTHQLAQGCIENLPIFWQISAQLIQEVSI